MPFFIDFAFGDKKLRFFGSDHSKEKFHTNFLKKKLDEFKPNLILVEGGYEIANYDSEKEALNKGLELGFTNFYAKKNNIKLKGNDPHHTKKVSFLESFYDKNHVFLHCVLGFSLYKSPDWSKEKLIKYMNDAINNFKAVSNWKNFEYSYKNFQKIFLEILKEKFKIKESHIKWINPQLKISELNSISRKETLYRDYYMLNKIMEEFKEYDKIFVVKGNHHLRQMKKVLGELFE
jgi:hypothetical protein